MFYLSSTFCAAQNVAMLIALLSEKTPALNLLDHPVVAGVSGAVLTATATYYAWIKVPSERRRYQHKLDYVTLQLKDLYGPLVAECVRTDRIFLRVQKATDAFFSEAQHHSDVSPLLGQFHTSESYYLALFTGQMLSRVYQPSNHAKAKLIRDNVHLFGHNPPLSLYLFLLHSAEMEAIADVGAASRYLDLNTTSEAVKSVCRISPFPVFFSPEVYGKVALLKHLQREYSHQLNRIGFRSVLRKALLREGETYIFNRTKYYLELPKDRYTKVVGSLQAQQPYDCRSLPRLWGPYLAVELIEMRSWLISQIDALGQLHFRSRTAEDTVGNMLLDMHSLCDLFLRAKLVVTAEQEPTLDERLLGDKPTALDGSHGYLLEDRVFQLLDYLDPLETKRSIVWETDVTLKQLCERRFVYVSADRMTLGKKACSIQDACSLRDLPKWRDFAFDPDRFGTMHGM